MNILQEADQVVNQRQVAYDKPENNLARIATYWTAHFKAKYNLDITITSADVAACNILQKMAREDWSHKTDNLIDIAGYAQCWESSIENNTDS